MASMIQVSNIWVCTPHGCPCIDGVGRLHCLICGCKTTQPVTPLSAKRLAAMITDKSEVKAKEKGRVHKFVNGLVSERKPK